MQLGLQAKFFFFFDSIHWASASTPGSRSLVPTVLDIFLVSLCCKVKTFSSLNSVVNKQATSSQWITMFSQASTCLAPPSTDDAKGPQCGLLVWCVASTCWVTRLLVPRHLCNYIGYLQQMTAQPRIKCFGSSRHAIRAFSWRYRRMAWSTWVELLTSGRGVELGTLGYEAWMTIILRALQERLWIPRLSPCAIKMLRIRRFVGLVSQVWVLGRDVD